MHVRVAQFFTREHEPAQPETDVKNRGRLIMRQILLVFMNNLSNSCVRRKLERLRLCRAHLHPPIDFGNKLIWLHRFGSLSLDTGRYGWFRVVALRQINSTEPLNDHRSKTRGTVALSIQK